MLAVIEWSKVGEVIWVSAVAGIGVTALFSLAIYGSSRSAESRRTGNGNGTAYAALAAVSLTVFAAVLVFGLIIALSKS
jgi:hypothetical protein